MGGTNWASEGPAGLCECWLSDDSGGDGRLEEGEGVVALKGVNSQTPTPRIPTPKSQTFCVRDWKLGVGSWQLVASVGLD